MSLRANLVGGYNQSPSYGLEIKDQRLKSPAKHWMFNKLRCPQKLWASRQTFLGANYHPRKAPNHWLMNLGQKWTPETPISPAKPTGVTLICIQPCGWLPCWEPSYLHFDVKYAKSAKWVLFFPSPDCQWKKLQKLQLCCSVPGQS